MISKSSPKWRGGLQALLCVLTAVFAARLGLFGSGEVGWVTASLAQIGLLLVLLVLVYSLLIRGQRPATEETPAVPAVHKSGPKAGSSGNVVEMTAYSAHTPRLRASAGGPGAGRLIGVR